VGRHGKAVSRLAGSAGRCAHQRPAWGPGRGVLALLSVAARYPTCGLSAHSLACRAAGTSIGGWFVIGVIATVTAATALTDDRGPDQPQCHLGLLGTSALAVC
jgi:hypothetical protein